MFFINYRTLILSNTVVLMKKKKRENLTSFLDPTKFSSRGGLWSLRRALIIWKQNITFYIDDLWWITCPISVPRTRDKTEKRKGFNFTHLFFGDHQLYSLEVGNLTPMPFRKQIVPQPWCKRATTGTRSVLPCSVTSRYLLIEKKRLYSNVSM